MRRNSHSMNPSTKMCWDLSRTPQNSCSIGFRESSITQIRKTKPTVREYLKQTRYTGSGHAGSSVRPSNWPTTLKTGLTRGPSTASICSRTG